MTSMTRLGVATAVACVFGGAAAFADSISPETFSADLPGGESITVRKTVVVDDAPPTSARIDTHFLIDTSGSMGLQVDAAKDAATDLFNSLTADFGDVNAGVGVFSEGAFLGTTPDNRNAIIGGGLTDNAATFQSNVDEVTLNVPNSGFDFPESGYDAIDLAGNDLSWRPGSNRFMFVFTDASAKGDLAAAQDTLDDLGINLVALAYNSGFSFVDSSYGTPLGGTVFDSATSVDDIIADVTAGIGAGFAEYSSVTVDDLGNGDPLIDVSTVCVSADSGTCVGAEAVGSFDRSVERTFEFDVTFTRTGAGDTTFDTYALVDGGIVATEVDTFTETVPPIPLPAAGWFLLAGIGAMGVASRRRAA